MQLSELRKKARRGKAPDPTDVNPPAVPVATAAPVPAAAPEDDEFLSPAPDPAPAMPVRAETVEPPVSVRTGSLMESIAAVEASGHVALTVPEMGEEQLGQHGLLENLSEATAEDDLVEYISFLAAGEPYVIRISRVKEIIRPRRLAVIPRAPAYVRGILSLRGEMIPVLDLRRSLGLSLERDVGSVLDSRIIVLAHDGAKLGLQVDRLEGVVRLDENLFRDPSEVQGSRDNRFLQAIGRFRGSFVIVLDVEEFFARGTK